MLTASNMTPQPAPGSETMGPGFTVTKWTRLGECRQMLTKTPPSTATTQSESFGNLREKSLAPEVCTTGRAAAEPLPKPCSP